MGNLDYPKPFVRNLHTSTVLVSFNGEMKCRNLDVCLADKREGEMKGRNEAKRHTCDCSTLQKLDCGKKIKKLFVLILLCFCL